MSTRPAHPAQTGSALIEVLVSAVLLLGAIVALLSVLDVQSAASGNAKASSAAAALAEADQERLRSFRVPDLANRFETQTKTVAGETFTIESRGTPLSDATGGTPSCANSGGQADYLGLVSTVTSARTKKPIVLRSIVAPPTGKYGQGQGTVAVKVVGGAGQAVQGANATITGPSKTASDNSNALGCTVFSFVPVGAYSVGVQAAGFVDPSGMTTAQGSATAAEGATNLTTVSYDRAGSVVVNVETTDEQGATTPSTATVLSAANAGVPGTGFRLFRPATPQATITADGLYPFSDPYTLYSGSCPDANPAKWNANYFKPSPNNGSLVVAAGGNPATVTIREPALRLRLRGPNGMAVLVRAKLVGAGCTDVFEWTVTPGEDRLMLPDAGVPFGNYDVCVQGNGMFAQIAGVAVTDPTGSARQDVDLRTGQANPAGTCPP